MQIFLTFGSEVFPYPFVLYLIQFVLISGTIDSKILWQNCTSGLSLECNFTVKSNAYSLIAKYSTEGLMSNTLKIFTYQKQT